LQKSHTKLHKTENKKKKQRKKNEEVPKIEEEIMSGKREGREKEKL
jgi:hypothetical protein